ncbi:telomeric repeat binding factor 1 [Diaporthe helianthi]|uniref:Telomeric repeat binding factor 1 n=1 Tax=Diaporthe helianthi TaxID=158607 RepID=A0A2P5HSL3_DIAHE|nr:telomeric repeat binding factor 1 [Diaporthe helianthi]
MADAAGSASPAPALATQPRSETRKNEHNPATKPTTPIIKTEEGPQQLEAIARTEPNRHSQDAPRSPTPSKNIKVETNGSSNAPSTVQKAVPAIPTVAAVVNTSSVVPAVAPPPPPAVAAPPAPLATPAAAAAVPAAESATPAKRSRTPEPSEEHSADKKQKTEHVPEHDIQNVDTKTEAEASVSTGAEAGPNGDGVSSWDLESMLANALGAVNDAKGTAGADFSMDIDSITSSLPLPLPPPRRRLEKMKFIETPTYFSRSMGLPILGSLAVQILLALFQQPSEVTDKIIRDARTEGGKVYVALRATFMATLKLFTDSTAFLNADDLDIHDPGDRETIQMANLANMCASFYGPGGPTMATAHDYFLNIMIPENGMITEDISALYLDQKTQSFLAYANVMEDKESTRNSLMDKFFPKELEGKLRAYYRESDLNISGINEDEFVRPFTDRRNLLKAVGHDKEKRRQLEAKYQFATFLDNLSAFIRSNFESIVDYAEGHGFEIPNEPGEEEALLLEGVQPPSTYTGAFPGQRRPNGTDLDSGYEATGLASLIAEKLAPIDINSYGQASAGGGDGSSLPPTQSLPTAVLYERARQAAVAKTPTAHARKEGLHSTRRPWTPEEEKALMQGLDMVKGPHWSQILQLFGLNGTLSDILKDRTQVQLKDKARNLKLFFLKTNSEMPYYLQCVTGELKTRAPGQAARKEAEEQARQGSYAPSYPNGTTTTSTITTATQGHHAAAPARLNQATPNSHPSTLGVPGGQHYQQQQASYQQQHQPYQQNHHQQNHHHHNQQQQQQQQHRPQQILHAAPVPSHAAFSHQKQENTASRPATQAPSHHQSIAPAPVHQQRPLQQAVAPTNPQYNAHQRRPAQPNAQPISLQQPQQYAQPQPQRPAAMALPPRPGSASVPQVQTRSPAPASAVSRTAPPSTAASPTTAPAPVTVPTAASGQQRPHSQVQSQPHIQPQGQPQTQSPAPKTVPANMPAPPTPTPSPLTPTVASSAASPSLATLKLPGQLVASSQSAASTEAAKKTQPGVPPQAETAQTTKTTDDTLPSARDGGGAEDDEHLKNSLLAALKNA